MNVCMALENDETRLEEVSKNFMTFDGKLTFHQYLDRIDEVTSERVNRAASAMLIGKPTVVAIGSTINLVPSTGDLLKMLNG